MNISHFFIDRPIFAAVISIIITLLGAVAYFSLPVAQYPDIAPPSISVTASYPGASAEIVAKTVATLDVLSGGRSFCGIGAGWWAREHAGFGLPFPSAGARLD